jgi:hypothetical protein
MEVLKILMFSSTSLHDVRVNVLYLGGQEVSYCSQDRYLPPTTTEFFVICGTVALSQTQKISYDIASTNTLYSVVILEFPRISSSVKYAANTGCLLVHAEILYVVNFAIIKTNGQVLIKIAITRSKLRF